MKTFIPKFALLVAIALLTTSLSLAQAGTPFVTVPGSTPPPIGQPSVSLAWDTTNKLLVVTFSATNSTGVSQVLTTSSYNPHTLEGIGAGGFVLSIGGVAVLLQHNLPTDPLSYQIGVSNATGTIVTMAATCSKLQPPPTGQTACPALPF